MIYLSYNDYPFKPEFTIVQAANRCRNSRLVVDEDDLMWFKTYRKLPCIGKLVSWEFRYKNLGCGKIKSVFRDV